MVIGIIEPTAQPSGDMSCASSDCLKGRWEWVRGELILDNYYTEACEQRRHQRWDLQTGRQSFLVCRLKNDQLALLAALTSPPHPPSRLHIFSSLNFPFYHTFFKPRMNSSLPPVPPSPGVGARRKGPGKALPRLPLSAFSPPPSGTSDSFPRPPSPSTIHPEKVIDAHVVAPGGDLNKWTQEISKALDGKIAGAVVSLSGTEPSEVEKAVDSCVYVNTTVVEVR